MSATSFLHRAFLKYFQTVFRWIFPHYKDISEEIVLITGGGRGLGRKIALQLAKCKPRHIVIWGRKEAPLQQTTDDIISLGVPASNFVCDVSSRDQVYEKAKEVQETVGPVTMLINNAGVVYGGTVLESSDEDIIRTLQVNALAHIWTIKAFLPSMIENNHGHIVCMSSMLGLLGLKGTGDYSASKFASTGFMESLMLELEKYPGIQLSSIHPYQIANDMFAGAHVRFPRLFPPLNEDYVVRESVKAILTNRKQLNIPAFFNLVLFFKSVLPVSCLIPVFRFLGLDTTMDGIRQENPSSPSSSHIS